MCSSDIRVLCSKFGHCLKFGIQEWLTQNQVCRSFRQALKNEKNLRWIVETISKLRVHLQKYCYKFIHSVQKKLDFNLTDKCAKFEQKVRTKGTLPYYDDNFVVVFSIYIYSDSYYYYLNKFIIPCKHYVIRVKYSFTNISIYSKTRKWLFWFYCNCIHQICTHTFYTGFSNICKSF